MSPPPPPQRQVEIWSRRTESKPPLKDGPTLATKDECTLSKRGLSRGTNSSRDATAERATEGDREGPATRAKTGDRGPPVKAEPW